MDTLCKREFKRIIWSPFLIIITCLFCITPGVMASISEIDDFNGAAGPPSGTWSTTATIDVDSQTQVADPAAGTDESCSITGNGDVQIDWVAPGKDWTTPPNTYNDIGFFVYGTNGGQTIDIDIVEGDNVAAAMVDETWSLSSTITVNWTGWKHFRYSFTSDFGKTGVTGDNTWNPDVNVSAPQDTTVDYDGVKQIKFTIGNNVGNTIYIDEIYVSLDGSTFTVYQTFPIDDVEDNSVDAIVDWPPSTVSAVFDWNPTTDSTIRLVNESAVTNCLNSNIELYSASVDNFYGIFATPDTPLSAGTYTIFIVPKNGTTARGVAQVVRFTVSDTAGTPNIETKHSGTRMY